MVNIDLDKVYRTIIKAAGVIALLTMVLVVTMIVYESIPSMKKFSFNFITSIEWDPTRLQFGGGVFLLGSVLTTILAVVMAVPPAIGCAIFLSEYAPGRVREAISLMVEMLAGIPSVVYGLWGLYWLIPFFKSTLVPLVTGIFGFLPLFRGPFYGVGILTTSSVLGIMILPIIAVITYEVIELVPTDVREGAYALGATKSEVVLKVVLRMARPGIIAGMVLGLGRAFGETMVTAMLIGGSYEVPSSLFSPAYTLASVIAHEFRYAMAESVYRSAMMELALILLVISLLTSIVARLIVRRVAVR